MMQQINEGGERGDFVEGTGGGADQLEAGEPAEARADMAAADVVGEDMVRV